MKKVLSVLLASLLAMCLTVTPAFAAPVTTVTDVSVTRTSADDYVISFNADGDGHTFIHPHSNGVGLGGWQPFVTNGPNSISAAVFTATHVEITVYDSANTLIFGPAMYPIPAWVAPSQDKDITSFSVGGVSGTVSGTNVTVTVPYGTDVTALTPAVAHTGASITPSGPQDFTSAVTYIVTAQDGSTKAYVVKVTVADKPGDPTNPAASTAPVTPPQNNSGTGSPPKTGDTTWSIAPLIALGSLGVLTLLVALPWRKKRSGA